MTRDELLALTPGTLLVVQQGQSRTRLARYLGPKQYGDRPSNGSFARVELWGASRKTWAKLGTGILHTDILRTATLVEQALVGEPISFPPSPSSEVSHVPPQP